MYLGILTNMMRNYDKNNNNISNNEKALFIIR